MFEGVITALVTPFDRGAVDLAKLDELVEAQIEGGVAALSPCGTTGEAPTLDLDEKTRVIERVVKRARDRVPVIAGTGSYSTRETVELTRRAKELGARGALVVTPYYNRPSQEGLFRHYTEVAEHGGLPVLLYNVPGRSGVNLLPETAFRLSAHPNVQAIKEASGSLDQASRLVAHGRLSVLSGDDSLTVPMMAIGAKGVVSVASNLLPRPMADLVRAAATGDAETARVLHLSLFPILRALFLETNPVPVKTALRLAGRLNGEVRLPLVPMTRENEEALRVVLVEAGLLP